MSADNWTTCPRCKINTDNKQRENEKAMIEAYGKVPPEEYEKLRAVVLKGVELEDSLREDYEQGIRDGEYSVSYEASCRICGFKFSYEHKEKVKP